MPRIVTALLTVFLGPVLGWYLLVGFCGMPWFTYSNACGHNAYLWLPIFIPAGMFPVWFFLKSCTKWLKKANTKEATGIP